MWGGGKGFDGGNKQIIGNEVSGFLLLFRGVGDSGCGWGVYGGG